MPASPPPSWKPPRLVCFIAGTTRSGSTYLSALMENTGVLGRPREFFNHTVEAFGAHGVEAPVVDPELSAPVQRRAHLFRTVGMTPNGVAATKLFRMHLVWMARHIHIAEWFPAIRWIYLTREDKLGQAISSAIVNQTKRFQGGIGLADTKPVYSPERIEWVLRFNLASEAFLQAYFITNRIAPLRITYEDLARDPETEVRRIAEHLGEELSRPVDVQTSLVKQRTELNDQWRELFLKEHLDLNRIEYTTPSILVPRSFSSFKQLALGKLRVGPYPDPID